MALVTIQVLIKIKSNLKFSPDHTPAMFHVHSYDCTDFMIIFSKACLFILTNNKTPKENGSGSDKLANMGSGIKRALSLGLIIQDLKIR